MEYNDMMKNQKNAKILPPKQKMKGEEGKSPQWNEGPLSFGSKKIK